MKASARGPGWCRRTHVGTCHYGVQSNNTYQDQLSLYLADCPTMKRRLKGVSYFASSLQRTFADYYACTSQPLAFQLRSITKHQFGLLAGVTHTNLSFSDVKNDMYPTLDSYTQVGPTGGGQGKRIKKPGL
jgi:hypothetical protein